MHDHVSLSNSNIFENVYNQHILALVAQMYYLIVKS